MNMNMNMNNNQVEERSGVYVGKYDNFYNTWQASIPPFAYPAQIITSVKGAVASKASLQMSRDMIGS